MKKYTLLFCIYLLLLAKLTTAQTPNWLWAEGSGGGAYEGGVGISADPSGNIFTDGRLAGMISLGGLNATGGGTDNPYVGEFDSSGKGIWLQEHDYSLGEDYVYGFYRDSKDNTYSVGIVNSGVAMYFDKHNSAGNLAWSVIIPGTVSGYGIAADNAGNVYITGEYEGAATFGATTLTSAGSKAIFIAKCDSNANFRWAASVGGAGYDGGRDIAVDNSGYIYLCGSYNGLVSFGSIVPPVASASYPNFFIAKYDTSGNAQWVTVATNAGFGTTFQFFRYESITVDSCSNLYVTGFFTDTAQFGNLSVISAGAEDIFVAKCLNNGQWEWVQSAGGTGSDIGYGISLDKHSDVYITGSFSGTALFGSQLVTTSAGSSAFAAKYANSSGALQWVQTAGGTGATAAEGITADSKGYVYLTGSFAGNSSFGATSLTATATPNIFIAKFDTVPARTIVPVISASYCPGSIDILPYTVTGTFNPGNVFTAQLSDSTGSFANPITIGTVNSDESGTITITIPANMPPGAVYLMRVVSSSPATSSYANGCGAYYQQNVYPNDFYVSIGGSLNVSIIPSNPAVCPGSSILLAATGGSMGYRWKSEADTTTLATTDTFTVSPTTTTTYYVIVSNGTCIGIDSVVVTVAPTLTVTIAPQSPAICSGQSVKLTINGGGVFYAWSPSVSLSSSTGDSVIATPSITTAYTVVGYDSVGCTVTGTDTVSVDSCGNEVWPGDVNDDLIVNNYDLISIGLYYGDTGPARDSVTNEWQAQTATDWGTSQSNGYDIKYVDCNGDGTINSDDTIAVTLNYGLTHLYHAPRGSSERTSGTPLYFIADSSLYHAGSKVHVAVWLGNSTTQVSSIYALGYDIYLNTSDIQTGTISFNGNNSFIGTKNASALTLTQLNNDVETAITRINHHNTSGYGKIGDLYFTLSANISNPQCIISFESSAGVDSAGKAIPLQMSNDTLNIKTTAGINQLSVNSNQLSIYPNPSSNKLTIINYEAATQKIEIDNVLGETMLVYEPQITKTGTAVNLDVSRLADGIYFVRITSNNEAVTKKMIVSK